MQGERENGIAIGIVTSLEDPEGLGRVKVKYPNKEEQESHWARLVSLMAGKERGAFFRPEVEDEVLVAYEYGDPRRPYILGAVWSQVDRPPIDDGKPKENNWRFIRSRSGHVVKLNDQAGAETIEIIDKSGNNSVIVDTAKNTITIAATQTIKIEAPSVEVTGKTNVKVEAPSIEVKGQASVSIEAPAIDVKASALLNLQGGLVKIN